jgi:flagellar motor protein MotB
MKSAATIATTTALLLLSLGSTGCVQQDRYDQLLQAHRALQEQLVLVKDERDAYRSSVDSAQVQAQRYNSELGSLQQRYDTLEGEFGTLSADTADYLSRISSLEIGPLPIDLASALDQVAAAYPELVSFDVQRGMLRFNSDFTFDLGSAELAGDAQPTIMAIADIMNSASAHAFDARVVGHTDNVPIRRAETIRKYPTNLYLSVARSISVRDALVSAGVGPARLEVAGWGEFHPVVANGTRGATENRRVELYFVPSTAVASLPPSTSTEAPQTSQAEPDFPMK